MPTQSQDLDAFLGNELFFFSFLVICVFDHFAWAARRHGTSSRASYDRVRARAAYAHTFCTKTAGSLVECSCADGLLADVVQGGCTSIIADREVL